MDNNNLSSIRLKSCNCNETITLNLDASKHITRLLRINMNLTNLCPNSRIGVNITVYSKNRCEVANSSFEIFVPCDIRNINKQAVIVLPSSNICRKSEYWIVVTYNTLC